ncbi:hypothetical protein PIB30_036498 [Stylosanthes scabra]|uniref:Uncharacterized protein n=1 Tax=Stylosanthes scabra TaxID=79078 RepID=A0ABU6ZBS9_9FABA|nr:hypothetical protein [Stylosanthes scabra]
MLPISFGAARSGSPPTPPPRDSSPDEPRQRDRSPQPEIRASVNRSLRFTAPEYRSFFHAQPPQESTLVIEISFDDDTEDSAGTESGRSSDSIFGLYSTSTSSSDVTSGRSYDNTDRSSGSFSDMAQDGPSPSAKGKAKVWTLPTRASPKLAVLRAQVSPSSPAPIPCNRTPCSSYSSSSPTNSGEENHADICEARGGPSTTASQEHVLIEISSEAEPEAKLEDAIDEVVEMDKDLEEDPKEAPEEEEEDENEDPKEDPEEEEVQDHFRA